MTPIDINKFNKIVQKYCWDKQILREVREHILETYTLSEKIKVGSYPVAISDNSTRWSFLKRKDRYFNLEFSYWGIPEDFMTCRRPFLHLAYNEAWELTKDEFNKRLMEELNAEEVISEAMNIINQ